jgi:hypothetical protein
MKTKPALTFGESTRVSGWVDRARDPVQVALRAELDHDAITFAGSRADAFGSRL